MRRFIKLTGILLFLLGLFPYSLSAQDALSDQQMPMGRIHKWKEQGQIRVFLLGTPVREFKLDGAIYQLNVHEALKFAVEELDQEILFTPAVPLSLVDRAEGADIFLGLYSDSLYLKSVWGSSRSRNLFKLLNMHPGITLIVDKDWELWGLSASYDDSKYDYTECLVAPPQSFVFNLSDLTVIGYRRALDFQSPSEKIRSAIQAVAKHELYHALGLTHQQGCHSEGKGSGCSVMASDSKMLWLYPSVSEIASLEEIWR